MSEKRKIQRFNLDEGRIWEAIEGLSPFKTTYTLEEVCEKLNEQQATINHLEKVNGKNFAKRRLLEQDNLILRNENEQLRKQCLELEKDYVIETSDISDRIYLDDEIKELKQKYGVEDE